MTGELRPLYGHRRAVGARLCPSRDRSRRSDHRDRPRHGGEAAVLHGAGRADGAACRLSAGDGRGGVLSASRAHRRCRRRALTLLADRLEGRLPRAQALLRPARRHSRPHRRPGGGEPLSADAAADRARRAPGDAGGRHRLPRQRHVQDLVRAQLPHPCREHAAARQCARHDGRRAALGDHGGAAQSRTDACWPSAATAAS